MQLIKSRFLDDGKLFNNGQEAMLIHMENDADYETLLCNIVSSNYYDSKYSDVLGYQKGVIRYPAWYEAEMTHHLLPGSVLELGSGRGDGIALLNENGVDSWGIEFSEEIVGTSWPQTEDKIICGDILEVCLRLKDEQRLFDTVIGFDVWEHFLPRSLDDYIEAVISATTIDAMFFFVIPAFGWDRVFGEQFPNYFHENIKYLESGDLFQYLLLEKEDPVIPAQGHLINAPACWWQRRFEAHGLCREVEIERNLHTFFDEMLNYYVRSFFIFSRGTSESMKRAIRITNRPYTLFKKWRMLFHQRRHVLKAKQPCLDSATIAHCCSGSFCFVRKALWPKKERNTPIMEPVRFSAKLRAQDRKAHIHLSKVHSIFRVGQSAILRVGVENASDLVWRPSPFKEDLHKIHLGNHWLDEAGNILCFDDGRAPLRRELFPGKRTNMMLQIRLPVQPGQYILELDMVQEGVGWFQDSGSQTKRVPIKVR